MASASLPPALTSALQNLASRLPAEPEQQVLLAQRVMAGLTGAWVLFWPMPTEVVGQGNGRAHDVCVVHVGLHVLYKARGQLQLIQWQVLERGE